MQKKGGENFKLTQYPQGGGPIPLGPPYRPLGLLLPYR